MTSFGESHLVAGGKLIGSIRLQAVSAEPAVYPRLSLRFGVELRDLPDQVFESDRPVERMELRELRGVLRVSEHGKILGGLVMAERHNRVRSSKNAGQTQVHMACDLDWGRLEQLEAIRNGGDAVVWVELWPDLWDASGSLYCDVRAFRADLPHSQWLPILQAFQGERRSLVEVLHPGRPSPEFDAALGHLADAVNRIPKADYDEAVAACRRAIEAACKALNIPTSKPEHLQAALAAVVDKAQAKAYTTIVSQIKVLGNETVHRSSADAEYGRSEATFIVGVTQQLVGFLAGVLGPRAK
jgi:hypothetical protein